MQEWDIKPRGEACSDCQTVFADQQPYFSALVFGAEGYQRADYCDPCWQARPKEQILPYSVWQGIFKLPPAAPEEALKKETAESLLRKYMEEDNPASANIIYILAVMLERKRILVERDVRTNENGVLIRVYEHRKTGETFLVPDPRLQLDQLEKVQLEVITLLGGPVKKTEQAPDAGAGNPAEQKSDGSVR